MTNLTMLKLRDVCQLTGYARTTVYDYAQRGLLTKPVKMGKRASAWPANEVSAITAARIAGKPACHGQAFPNHESTNFPLPAQGIFKVNG